MAGTAAWPWWLTLLGMLAGPPADAAARSVVDDAGNRVVLEAPAGRVIALAPHLAEAVFALGAGDRLVGTVRHSDYPAAARSVPRVGDAFSVSLERILELRPDLVLGWLSGTPSDVLNRIRRLGFPLYLAEPGNLDGVADNLAAIGELLGLPEVGAGLAAAYRERLSRAHSPGRGTVAVFYEVWSEPLMTVSDAHLIGQAVAHCGGRNLFADSPAPVPVVSLEAVVAGDPAVILRGSTGAEGDAWTARWHRFPALRAVRHGHLLNVPADLVSRPGPRLVEGVERICELLNHVRASRGNG